MERSRKFAILKKVHECLEKIADMDTNDSEGQFLTLEEFQLLMRLDASIENSMFELLED